MIKLSCSFFAYAIFMYIFAKQSHIYTPMSKKSRHNAIRQILKNEEIGNQDALLSILINKGFELTQATLSRDMKELKVVKAPTASGIYAYKLNEDIQPVDEHTDVITSHGFIKIEFSGQLAVIKTRPGYAMAIAAEIDKKATKHVLGTVAGDDTILVIPREDKTKKEVMDSLSTFIPNLK